MKLMPSTVPKSVGLTNRKLFLHALCFRHRLHRHISYFCHSDGKLSAEQKGKFDWIPTIPSTRLVHQTFRTASWFFLQRRPTDTDPLFVQLVAESSILIIKQSYRLLNTPQSVFPGMSLFFVRSAMRGSRIMRLRRARKEKQMGVDFVTNMIKTDCFSLLFLPLFLPILRHNGVRPTPCGIFHPTSHVWSMFQFHPR